MSKTSGCLDGYPSQGLARDHFQLNKFSDPNEIYFVRVTRALRDLCDQPASLQRINFSPDSQQTGLMSLPYRENKNFQGRESDLKKLNEKLRGSNNSQKSCVIRGMGGMGKTQLALQFCYLNQEQFRYIFWIRAEDETNLADSFSRIASLLSLVPDDSNDQQRNIEIARRWFTKSLELFPFSFRPSLLKYSYHITDHIDRY